MRTNLSRLAWLRPAPAIFFAAATLAASGLTASAGATNIVYGTVQHVSTNNIKVAVAHTNNSLSFEIVPKFDQVFSSDGKATYQMKDVKPGTFVKVTTTRRRSASVTPTRSTSTSRTRSSRPARSSGPRAYAPRLLDTRQRRQRSRATRARCPRA